LTKPIAVATVINMEIEFDLAKDVINIEKHDVSLAEANHLEWDELEVWIDQRMDYGETRLIGYAPLSDRLHCVVYTDREHSRRIISLRKANRREVLNYVRIHHH